MSYLTHFTYTLRRRKEREQVAKHGVPEVWGVSPPRPDIE